MSYRALFLVCALVSASAFAQNNRSAVSVLGNDANTCTVQSPCRSFAKAITVTNSGGEILALDSGGYGTFSIDRAVTVRPVPGAYAGITVTAGSGVSVSVGPTDNVILRGITINGLGGSYGVNYYAGHSLIMENCAVDRMASIGIVTVDADGLIVSDTTVADCGLEDIQVGNGAATIYATIVNSRLIGSTYGIAVYQGGNVTVANTTVAGNQAGVAAITSTAATNADVVVESSTISGNGVGIRILSDAGTSTVRVSNSTIAHNATGLSTMGAGTILLLSRSNNTLQANTTNGAFTGFFTGD